MKKFIIIYIPKGEYIPLQTTVEAVSAEEALEEFWRWHQEGRIIKWWVA